MASQSDKIEITAPEVETKTAHSGQSDVGQDAEKQGIPQRPELKRKLKSRHLQMIAIGTFPPEYTIQPLLTVSRWNNRYWPLHRKRWRDRKIWSSGRSHRLHLRRYNHLQRHDFLG